MSMPERSLTLPVAHELRLSMAKMRKPPLLVLLHDRGGTAGELIKACASFDGRFLMISLAAPFRISNENFSWFAIEQMGFTSSVNSIQAEYSRQTLKKTLAEIEEGLKISPDHVYLLGFGQGAVIALNLLLTAPELLAGVVAISSEVLPEVRTMIAPVEQLRGKQVLLMHGLQDDINAVASGREVSSFMATLPVALTYQEFPSMGHYLTTESLQKANDWLSKRLDASGVIAMPETPAFTARLGGVHIKVRNLERSIAFYVRFLGMRVVEKTGKAYAFLANNSSHSVIALQKVGTQALLPSTQMIGLYRIRFEVPDQLSFARAYQTLANAKTPVTLTDHMICWSIHFFDPDGNGLEIYWDTRGLPGKSDIWQGRDLPLAAETVLSLLEPAGTTD